jgi:NAD(P)-dependent dehydrogenase (short-subunit alcohol dehydrogenase family)
MQGGYRYAIQSAQLTRAELLRIAESLTPVVAADGALASAEVTMCSRTAYGGTVVGAFTLRAGDLAAQDETRGGASGPHPLRSGFRDYPSDTPIVLCFLDGFIAAPGGPPPIPPATFRPYDRFRIDVLVNNAGHFYAGFFEELTLEQIERQLSTNLVGPMNETRAVLPAMRTHT